MGQGQDHKVTSEPQIEIQERGEIFFFYRPKVGKEEAHSAQDVQRLYIVLWPESGERPVEEKQDPSSGKEGSSKSKRETNSSSHGTPSHSGKIGSTEGGHGGQVMSCHLGLVYMFARQVDGSVMLEVNIEKQPLFRFIVMGKKSLPDPSNKKSRPYWGFVEMVTTNADDIKTTLKGEEYDTSTRGHRHNAPARAVGEGIYRILRHKSGKRSHTHLVYKLEFPSENEKEEPRDSLNIEHQASFIIQIKNPEQHGSNTGGGTHFRGLSNKRKAVFPACLQGKFGHSRYSPADPPDFLNYEGCELLLISASDDIRDELGLELETEEGAEEADPSSCSDLIKTFGETASATPLLKGTWV